MTEEKKRIVHLSGKTVTWLPSKSVQKVRLSYRKRHDSFCTLNRAICS